MMMMMVVGGVGGRRVDCGRIGGGWRVDGVARVQLAHRVEVALALLVQREEVTLATGSCSGDGGMRRRHRGRLLTGAEHGRIQEAEYVVALLAEAVLVDRVSNVVVSIFAINKK